MGEGTTKFHQGWQLFTEPCGPGQRPMAMTSQSTKNQQSPPYFPDHWGRRVIKTESIGTLNLDEKRN